ncbi:MAG: outer membrane protein assembly factor BamA [Devosia nanyangense]|uniref:Outer membrane protein assembly factor BamA n=1 Tax=Devosia nanyangense TaxID=1228055 RepID=A0A933KZ72_9HYPH|nr:outer membrane protein assembly factor BamA [Devosia nanyangense]
MIDPAKLLRSFVLALALLFVAPIAGIGGSLLGVEAAQAATVSKISVVGNSRVDDATVAKYLALGVGDVATTAKLNASVDALQATGLFKTVSVTMQGSTLVVKVSENSVVASVMFEGNQRFSDANLVAMIDLMNRGTVDDAGLARDVQSITKAYEDVGYNAVSVTTRLDPVGDGRLRVVFVIIEGGRVGIAAINFTGNNSINAWALKAILRTHETSWLSWLLRDDNYTQEQLDIDRELIRQYYANHGFPDAQVTSAVAEYNAERNGYFISYTIVEGDRYSFGPIEVETSMAGLDANTLTGMIRTREGDRFSAADLERSAQDMAVEATNSGYPFADVRTRIVRDAATGTFAVTYLVDEGQHLYVERINITGNDKTRDFVIRRELNFAEGDPFNRALVTQGKLNIEALGFFSNVSIAAEGGSAADKVVLNIAVVEQSTGDYGITAGYDSASGILGELSLTERNFLGRGQYVKASVGASQAGRTFDFSFTEPYFMGLKMSAGIDAYQHIVDETTTNLYGTTITGGQLRFGLPVTRDVSASVFGGLAQTVIADADATNSEIFVDGDVFNKAWIGYTLAYNTLDDQKHPTEGLTASLTQQYVGYDYNFLKTEAKARYFMPLNSDMGLIGSIKVQGGIINDFSGAGVNPLETFTYGSQLVRGFTPRQMGPQHTGVDGIEPLGFTAYAGASAEMTFPIPMLPETYGLSGAIWADAAIIAGAGTGASIDAASVDQPLKSSVGGSIIWDSPFGPLRGDMAFVLTQATEDSVSRVCASVYCPVFQLTLQTLL